MAIVVSEASTSPGSSASAEKPGNRRSLIRADDGAEQLLLAAEMGIDGGLRDAGLARDRIHADRAEAAGEKRALGGGEDASALPPASSAARRARLAWRSCRLAVRDMHLSEAFSRRRLD